MIDPGLAGKVALVTGANHGIGAAIARAFAAQGARVFITYLALRGKELEASSTGALAGLPYASQRASTANDVLASIRTAGGTAEAIEADLAIPDTIVELFDRAEAAFGPVDVLINNAAYWEVDSFLPAMRPTRDGSLQHWSGENIATLTPETIDKHFAVNSRAVALMMSEFARRHVARDASWGRIVNISTSGAHNFPGEVSYGASKYAVESYTNSAASELGQFGINANIISPGPTQTGWITPEIEQAIAAGTPLRRIGYPEDIADVAVFLCSDQARWVTGQHLHVGGGHHI